MTSYFNTLFNKRINRSTFALGLILYAALFLVLYVLHNMHIIDSFYKQLPLYMQYLFVYILVALFFLLYILLVGRRLHDTGSNAIGFSDATQVVAFDIRAIFKKGDPDRNIYGDPPKPGVNLKALFGF